MSKTIISLLLLFVSYVSFREMTDEISFNSMKLWCLFTSIISLILSSLIFIRFLVELAIDVVFPENYESFGGKVSEGSLRTHRVVRRRCVRENGWVSVGNTHPNSSSQTNPPISSIF